MRDLLYELCWQLGGKDCLHPDRLQQELTLKQIAGWIAWMRKEPRGERRADVRMAFQTAYLRQVHVDGTESPETFLPKFSEVVTIKDARVNTLVDDFLNAKVLGV